MGTLTVQIATQTLAREGVGLPGEFSSAPARGEPAAVRMDEVAVVASSPSVPANKHLADVAAALAPAEPPGWGTVKAAHRGTLHGTQPLSRADVEAVITASADDLERGLRAMSSQQLARIVVEPRTVGVSLGAIEVGAWWIAYQGTSSLYASQDGTRVPPFDPAHPETAIAALRSELVARLGALGERMFAKLAEDGRDLSYVETRVAWPRFGVTAR